MSRQVNRALAYEEEHAGFTPVFWFVTHYGTEDDGALNAHTSAYWQGYKCFKDGEVMPDVVTEDSPCCAAPRYIPLCTALVVETNEGSAECVVVDRMRDDTIGGSPHVDLCPAIRRQILSSGLHEFGAVRVKGESR